MGDTLTEHAVLHLYLLLSLRFVSKGKEEIHALQSVLISLLKIYFTQNWAILGYSPRFIRYVTIQADMHAS